MLGPQPQTLLCLSQLPTISLPLFSAGSPHSVSLLSSFLFPWCNQTQQLLTPAATCIADSAGVHRCERVIKCKKGKFSGEMPVRGSLLL